jgi:hypothetical protein
MAFKEQIDNLLQLKKALEEQVKTEQKQQATAAVDPAIEQAKSVHYFFLYLSKLSYLEQFFCLLLFFVE